ncbi:MAG: primosomal protein N' (replication factor Y) - superfamily II helicase [Cocleimonas sp.]|nr:primosomal protein N' (replication factor Y) - superfamily II helicase [Cocleimonas sp.]
MTSITKKHDHSHHHSSDHQLEDVTQTHFPCEQCGADLIYSPDSQNLKCTYCGFHNPIPSNYQEIKEYDFYSALRELQHLKKDDTKAIARIIRCPSCAAQFSLEDEFSADCPFCGTPVVASTEQVRFIQPKSLLPFKITDEQAINAFDQWVDRLWFAPSSLKKISRRNEKLMGVYLPYWTYDSHTENSYRGQRGTIYYERQVFHAVVDGRRVQQVRSVPRIRWQAVSGHIPLHFDDVLIGASKTLPRNIIDYLEPWDLHDLVPYSEAYLSGFHSELYQITVDQGYLQAKQLMDHHIDRAIREDIGGDQQRIADVRTSHSETTFKHLLLPVWSAAFKYKGKTYRYVVNGRNGKIHGERPYSTVKIFFAIIFLISCLGGGLYVMEKSGLLDKVQGYQHSSPYNRGGYY